MLKTLLVCLALPFAALAAPWVLDCTGLADGIYSYTCFSYTECVGGSKGIIKCASNEVFSVDDGICVIPVGDKWPCANVKTCQHLENKRYADTENHCSTYYTCHNGYFYGHSYCPEGTAFDEDKQFCNWPGNLKPPCGTA